MAKSSYTRRRGMAFEERLNFTNKIYQTRNIALINKRPTPVKVLKSSGTRVLSGFYENKSTVDYDGCYRGRAIVFEAKSVSVDRFDLKNLQDHQISYLSQAHQHKAVSFVVIEFRASSEVYFCTFNLIDYYIRKANEGGRKSIPKDDLNYYGERVIDTKRAPMDYLEAVDRYIEKGVI